MKSNTTRSSTIRIWTSTSGCSPRDNIQMATIVAGFAYLAANRDEKMPRKPLPVPGQGGRRGGGGQQ